MKRKKEILFVSVVILISLMLSGCFFGSSGTKTYILNADFTIEEVSGKLVLDAGKTEVRGYSNPEYVWEIPNKELMTGKVVEVPKPTTVTIIQLTVKATRGDSDYVSTVSKIYDPDGETIVGEVYFTYERIGTRKYRFTASNPDGAKYWEWKFPSEDHWHGYLSNEVEYTFSSSGNRTVRLEIFDVSENQIGETYSKTINVH